MFLLSILDVPMLNVSVKSSENVSKENRVPPISYNEIA